MMQCSRCPRKAQGKPDSATAIRLAREGWTVKNGAVLCPKCKEKR